MSNSSSVLNQSQWHCPVWKVCNGTDAEMKLALKPAIELLHSSKVIGFPTETVYGLGGSALSDTAIQSIYSVKGRPSDNPLIVHISNLEQLNLLSVDRNLISSTESLLINKFWPGPLTILFPYVIDENTKLSKLVTCGLSTVAVRMPSHRIASLLIEYSNLPLAAPSANQSGRPSPTSALHVLNDLHNRGIAGVIDGGEIIDGIGLESTVVQCHDRPHHSSSTNPYLVSILRPGGVTFEMLEELVGKGKVQPHINQHIETSHHNKSPQSNGTHHIESKTETKSKEFVPIAPGMKYTHYAPRAPLTLVHTISTQFLIDQVKSYQSKSQNNGYVGILCFNDQISTIQSQCTKNVHVINLGNRTDLSAIGRNLYSNLRACDELSPQPNIIYCMAVIEEETQLPTGLAAAIMNRLAKAAGHQHIVDSKFNPI